MDTLKHEVLPQRSHRLGEIWIMPLQVAEAGCFGGTPLAAITVVAKHNAPVAEALAHTLCCLLHTPDASAKDPAEIQEKDTPLGHRGGTEFSPAIAWRWPGSGRRLRQRPRLTADAKLQKPTANVDEGWSAQAPLRIPRQQRFHLEGNEAKSRIAWTSVTSGSTGAVHQESGDAALCNLPALCTSRLQDHLRVYASLGAGTAICPRWGAFLAARGRS